MKDVFGVEIFDSGVFLVSISSTWGFFAYSKQFEVVILVINETEDVLGCPECCLSFFGDPREFSFFGGGGVDFVLSREME